MVRAVHPHRNPVTWSTFGWIAFRRPVKVDVPPTERRNVVTSLTIRNLDEDLSQRLRVRAAEHGRSMEEEAREILRAVVGDEVGPANLAVAIRARMASLDGIADDEAVVR